MPTNEKDRKCKTPTNCLSINHNLNNKNIAIKKQQTPKAVNTSRRDSCVMHESKSQVKLASVRPSLCNMEIYQ
jgi:hypothetical protein